MHRRNNIEHQKCHKAPGEKTESRQALKRSAIYFSPLRENIEPMSGIQSEAEQSNKKQHHNKGICEH